MEKPEEKTHTDEAIAGLDASIKEKIHYLLSDDLCVQLVGKLNGLRENNDSKETLLFKFGLLVRYLLSCLLDADRLNTADFETPDNVSVRNYGKYQPWEILISRLDAELQKFMEKKDKNYVDDIRNYVSHKCYESARKPQGIYQS